MKPHKHAELIKAWADGAVIEECIKGQWFEVPYPEWYEQYEFRIKPEQKPDVVRELAVFHSKDEGLFMSEKQHFMANLKLTFDGETGELKSAEVLK